MRLLLLALTVIALVAPASAQAPDETIDVAIVIPAVGPSVVEKGGDLARADPHVQGERYAWNLTLEANYTTFDVRVDGAFDVERARQIVPHLLLPAEDPTCVETPGACAYTLFEPFPHERIWDIDGPARVFHLDATHDSLQLRLGIPGHENVTLRGTLVLERDVTPPNFTLGPIENVTHYRFYRETHTDELAIGDLQVRKVGADEWIQNPTPTYHVYHKFPIQGLDADSEYELRVVFTDWAGNVATSPMERIRTAPPPAHPRPTITPITPLPNATLPSGADVTVRALVESPDSPIPAGGVRVFFGQRPIPSEEFTFVGGEVYYTPLGPLEDGLYRVTVEATNEAGGEASVRWSFRIGEPAADTPAPAWLALVAIAIVALRKRR